ncbi:Putative lysine-specific demethylase JMJ16 [Zea mays]|uniref:Putative lysine-specific demethylase JMJ16 n=1 Tax=Zea mays TaxID=4577 RepID=A0A1D6QB66_MAIZE|nr:Putative lysine-specific demethylase JMJ16 [Zea mays]
MGCLSSWIKFEIMCQREKDQDSKTPRRVADGPRRSYMSQASTVSLAPSLVCNEQNNNGNKMLDKASLETDTCPFTEQIKSGTISLQEAHMKTEVSCTLNSSVIPEGHKSSLSLPVPSGHSLFPILRQGLKYCRRICEKHI